MKTKKFETDYSRAREKFESSQAYKDATNPISIDAEERQRMFLQNRVELGFAVGWNAASELFKRNIIQLN